MKQNRGEWKDIEPLSSDIGDQVCVVNTGDLVCEIIFVPL